MDLEKLIIAAEWIMLRFPWKDSQLVVIICVAREAKSYRYCHTPGHTPALEV
jgi:hypothetical protein